MNSIIFLSLIASFLWASVNHIDKYLLSRLNGKGGTVGALFLVSCFISIPVLIGILGVAPWVLNIEQTSRNLLILNGCLFAFVVLPYLTALFRDDTSVVAPLFQFTPVVTYVLSIIFLGEQLSFLQLSGCVLITASAIFLSSERKFRSFRVKTNLIFTMGVVSVLLSISAISYKIVAVDLPFLQTIFWQHVGALITGVTFFLVVPTFRSQFLTYIQKNKQIILGLNGLNESLTIIGNVAVYYASLQIPVAIAWWIADGFQPFFVFLLGIVLTILFPKIVKENIQTQELLKKLLCLLMMIFGAFLLKN